MSRLSCVQSCICPDYRAFKVTYDQTIVRSKLHMSRLSCVQNCICPDYRAFKIAYVQTIVRSKLHMSRLSCVQNCICPDYRAFIFFSRPCNFERTTPPCAFISVWTYRLSVWHLNLGRIGFFFNKGKLKQKQQQQHQELSKISFGVYPGHIYFCDPV